MPSDRSVTASRWRAVNTESASAGLLLLATLIALAWSNSPWATSYEALWNAGGGVRIGGAELSMSLGQWVSDGLMTIFFFVIGLDVRREFSIGELTDRTRAMVPLVAGIAGMIIPAVLYLLINPSGEASRGWAVVIGTDTAFLLGALALLGPALSNQLRIFLLTLTVIDDIVAVAIIGVVYTGDLAVAWLTGAGLLLIVLALLPRVGVWRSGPYIVLTVLLWLATVQSGIHPAIAGMAAGLAIPAFAPRRDVVEGAASLFQAFRQSPMPTSGYTAKQGLARAVSVNERLHTTLTPWTSFAVVPLFALANAGVNVRGGLLADAMQSPVTWGVVLGLVLGKLTGIGGGALSAAQVQRAGLPQGVGPGQVLAGGALSGIGFTVSLLIVGLAFDTQQLRDEAIVGVLISVVVSTMLGWIIFRLAGVLHGEWTADLPRVLDRQVDVNRDHIRGRGDAPLTLVEYIDFECPFCASTTGVIHQLRAHYGDNLRYVVRHLPLPDVHPHSQLAAMAVEAAGDQGRFWDMHDMLFAHQDELEIEDILGYAGEMGLDVETFARDMEDPRNVRRIREDVASAEASGARNTPTFFIGDVRHVSEHDTTSLIRALDNL